MTESTVGWFIVKGKYCSLAEKVRLISQANRANGIVHSPVEAPVLKPPHNARTAILQGQALPALPLFGCLSKQMIHGSFGYAKRCLFSKAVTILEHSSCCLIYFCLWHTLLAKCLIWGQVMSITKYFIYEFNREMQSTESNNDKSKIRHHKYTIRRHENIKFLCNVTFLLPHWANFRYGHYQILH